MESGEKESGRERERMEGEKGVYFLLVGAVICDLINSSWLMV